MYANEIEEGLEIVLEAGDLQSLAYDDVIESELENGTFRIVKEKVKNED